MGVDTHVDHAQTRLDHEREALAAKEQAIDSFVDRVADVPVDTGGAGSGQPVGAGGTATLASPATSDACQAVRRAFAETVRPHSVEDVDDPEPLLETVRTELSPGVAVALSPETTASFTPTLRQRIQAEAASRRQETAVTIRALDREAESVEDAATDVDAVVDWLVSANEQPLTALGFDALAARHERLADQQDRLGDLVDARQTHLASTTSLAGDAAIDHEQFVAYLYQDFPVDHPVLATAARLEDVCQRAQRVVRDHLVRRA